MTAYENVRHLRRNLQFLKEDGELTKEIATQHLSEVVRISNELTLILNLIVDIEK